VKIIQSILILLSFIISINSFAFGSGNDIDKIRKGDIAHRSQTLFFLDQAFKKRNTNYLDKISTRKFRSSRFFSTLKKYIKTKRINWNHRTDVGTQQFIINNDPYQILYVKFEKHEDFKWYVSDAYVKKNGREQKLAEYGFSPGEINMNFWQFINVYSNYGADNYYGLAPFGKLNKDFIRSHKLTPSSNKTMQMQNIIIHNGRKAESMIYLTLKYFPAGHREGSTFKSGWLIDDGHSMSMLYPLGKDLYIDHLRGRMSSRINLNAPNRDTVYVNVPSARKYK
jgi:hypothetical protein